MSTLADVIDRTTVQHSGVAVNILTLDANTTPAPFVVTALSRDGRRLVIVREGTTPERVAACVDSVAREQFSGPGFTVRQR